MLLLPRALPADLSPSLGAQVLLEAERTLLLRLRGRGDLALQAFLQAGRRGGTGGLLEAAEQALAPSLRAGVSRSGLVFCFFSLCSGAALINGFSAQCVPRPRPLAWPAFLQASYPLLPPAPESLQPYCPPFLEDLCRGDVSDQGCVRHLSCCAHAGRDAQPPSPISYAAFANSPSSRLYPAARLRQWRE